MYFIIWENETTQQHLQIVLVNKCKCKIIYHELIQKTKQVLFKCCITLYSQSFLWMVWHFKFFFKSCVCFFLLHVCVNYKMKGGNSIHILNVFNWAWAQYACLIKVCSQIVSIYLSIYLSNFLSFGMFLYTCF